MGHFRSAYLNFVYCEYSYLCSFSNLLRMSKKSLKQWLYRILGRRLNTKQFIKTAFFPLITVIVFYALCYYEDWVELQVMRWATACSVFTFWALLSNCYVVFLLAKKGGDQWFFPLTGIFNWFIPFFLFGGRFITAEWISLTLIAAVTAILDLLAEAFSVKNTELVQDLK